MSIGLDKRLLTPPLVFAREDNPRSFIPTEWWAATMHAYQLHLQNPSVQLVCEPILFNEGGARPLQITFANIVNATIRDYDPDLDEAAVSISTPTTSITDDSCAKAEPYFGATHIAMLTPVNNLSYEDDERIEPVIGWTIIADGTEPVGIMKHLGEYTMLSLVPIRVDKIVFSPGMLFSIRVQRYLRYGGAKEVIGTHDVDRIRFLRPTIFAMQPADREVPSIRRNIEPEVRLLNLDVIQAAARLALEHSTHL